jgi:hypothetical protein
LFSLAANDATFYPTPVSVTIWPWKRPLTLRPVIRGPTGVRLVKHPTRWRPKSWPRPKRLRLSSRRRMPCLCQQTTFTLSFRSTATTNVMRGRVEQILMIPLSPIAACPRVDTSCKYQQKSRKRLRVGNIVLHDCFLEIGYLIIDSF